MTAYFFQTTHLCLAPHRVYNIPSLLGYVNSQLYELQVIINLQRTVNINNEKAGFSPAFSFKAQNPFLSLFLFLTSILSSARFSSSCAAISRLLVDVWEGSRPGKNSVTNEFSGSGRAPGLKIPEKDPLAPYFSLPTPIVGTVNLFRLPSGPYPVAIRRALSLFVLLPLAFLFLFFFLLLSSLPLLRSSSPPLSLNIKKAININIFKL